MREGYSWKKSLGKGLISILTLASAAVVFLGFGEVQLWDLIVNHVKPIVGTTTLLGLFAGAINFLKFNW